MVIKITRHLKRGSPHYDKQNFFELEKLTAVENRIEYNIETNIETIIRLTQDSRWMFFCWFCFLLLFAGSNQNLYGKLGDIFIMLVGDNEQVI